MNNMCMLKNGKPKCLASHDDYCCDHGLMYVVRDRKEYQKCHFFREDSWEKCIFLVSSEREPSEFLYDCTNCAARDEIRLEQKLEDI